MNNKDDNITIQKLKKDIKQFVSEREWDQFHDPKNLSMAISAEAAELVEKFIWLSNTETWQEIKENREEIEQEIADIAITLLSFCNSANIDLSQAIEKKLELNRNKYPIEKAKGKHTKYTKL